MIPQTNVLCCMVKNYDQLWDVVLSLESPHCNPSRISDTGDVAHLGLKTLLFFLYTTNLLVCVCFDVHVKNRVPTSWLPSDKREGCPVICTSICERKERGVCAVSEMEFSFVVLPESLTGIDFAGCKDWLFDRVCPQLRTWAIWFGCFCYCEVLGFCREFLNWKLLLG